MLFFKVSAFYFFYFATIGVYIIFLPKVLQNLSYTPYEIGIIFALAPLMRFLTPFLFLKHIKLNQNSFKIALFVIFITASLFYITIYDFYLFLITNAILGAALSLILPYIEIIALKNIGKERYGKSRLFGSIGFMAIALILARLLDDSIIALHFYLILSILTIVSSLILLKYDENEEISSSSDDSFSIVKYFTFWVSLFFMQVSFGGFYNFFTIYTTDSGISLEMASFLWSFGVLCEIIMLYFQGGLLKKNILLLIKISIFLTIIRWLLVYLYPDHLTMLFLSQSIHAFSFGLYHSAIIVYLYSMYSNKKLAQQFMFGIAYGLGGFVGAFVAGVLYGEYLFLYSALFALFAFIALLMHKKPISSSI
ncbi:MAG: MFS transporter [Arcobacteraceae bacterium]|jgi:PPP family 3-phenylpropionic acid transporter|nr:MFS transporter [Arcobacteraceae bacterium]MDY0365269.1 MFS transporter [Arcobacteraceae bacterium]